MEPENTIQEPVRQTSSRNETQKAATGGSFQEGKKRLEQDQNRIIFASLGGRKF